VVPTLGRRPDYLIQCLESIKNGGSGENKAFVVLVAPRDFDFTEYLSSGLAHAFVEDSGLGLPAAINEGFDSMPESIEYINWLGDDDLLSVGSLDVAVSHLEKDTKCVLVFGGCNYIDPHGKILWTNSSGSWAVPLLRFGPDLIPQPGALFRRTDFVAVGGLDSRYSWAFDFDLLIKLSKVGGLGFVNEVLSSFRWHPSSLSVEFRRKSVNEASTVRVSHLPAFLKPFSFLWEFPVRQATLIAGSRVTRKATRGELSR
jgi:hypothetical protein